MIWIMQIKAWVKVNNKQMVDTVDPVAGIMAAKSATDWNGLGKQRRWENTQVGLSRQISVDLHCLHVCLSHWQNILQCKSP